MYDNTSLTEMALTSGHKVEVIKGEELEKQQKDFTGYTAGLVRLTPGPWLFPTFFLNFADKYYQFKFRASDVVIDTYAKCGTTWTQEIVWTMRNNPDLNNPDAALPLLAKSPFLEFDMVFDPNQASGLPDDHRLITNFRKLCPGRDAKDGINLQMAECTPDPRTIKTHLPFSLLHPTLLDTCKVVYVARNPKDMVVSFYHHSRIINGHGYEGTLEDFVQYFLDDGLVFGSYSEHLKEAWQRRNHPNLHFMFFEDMKADPMREIKKLDSFLGTNLTTKQLENVKHYTSFSEMKKRNDPPLWSTNKGSSLHKDRVDNEGGFFRKGQTGDWKNKLTPELAAKVDAWTQKHLKNMGLEFKYSI